MRALMQYVDAGGAVLALSLDGASPSVLDGLTRVTQDNCHNIALGAYQGRAAGFYHDPDELLDAAVVDKFIVIRSFLSMT